MITNLILWHASCFGLKLWRFTTAFLLWSILFIILLWNSEHQRQHSRFNTDCLFHYAKRNRMLHIGVHNFFWKQLVCIKWLHLFECLVKSCNFILMITYRYVLSIDSSGQSLHTCTTGLCGNFVLVMSSASLADVIFVSSTAIWSANQAWLFELFP